MLEQMEKQNLSIRELAKKQGISIPEIEKRAGLSNGSISKWDKSRPLAENLKKVAEVLGVSIEELL